MNYVFSRSWAAPVGAALLATLPVAAPATPAAAVLAIDWSLSPARIASVVRGLDRDGQTARRPDRRSAFDAHLRDGRPSARERRRRLQRRVAAQGFLYNVSTDAKVRAASLKCSTDSGNALSELSARPDLYRALGCRPRRRHRPRGRPAEAPGAMADDLARSGAGLPDARRRTFVALQQKLTDDQNTIPGQPGQRQSP